MICPLCRGAITDRCSRCDVDFPPWGPLACLAPDPEAHRDDVAEALHHHLARIDGAVDALDRQLSLALADAARERVRHLKVSTGAARGALVEALAAIGIEPQPPSDAPRLQLLTSGTETLRDWGWDGGEHEENATALRLAMETLEEAGVTAAERILVLGAGAGRLAFDLHHALGAEETTALDIHPLPLALGARVAGGETIPWYEFPPAPRAGALPGVEVALVGRAETSPGLTFLVADGLAPPVAPGSVDLVVTPWFLDQVPRDRRALLHTLHGCLAPGGAWLHQGPLLYPAWLPTLHRHTLPEIEAMATEVGLTPVARRTDRLPYLASPHAAQCRLDDVTTMVARRDDAPDHDWAPSWLVDSTIPVPRLPDDGIRLPSHPVTAFVQAAIDGRTSIDTMAARVGERLRMGPSVARGSVREVVEAWTSAVRS